MAIHARRRIPASGVLWRPGLVVATHHTVHKDTDVPVLLAGGVRGRATVVGRDPGTDLVVLRLDDEGSVGEAAPAELAREPLRVGQLVLAVGRPGDSVTVTTVRPAVLAAPVVARDDCGPATSQGDGAAGAKR